MFLFHSRAEHFAAYLRDGLRRKQWIEPLPSIRDWARQLGVSRTTVNDALKILQGEGLILIEKRQGVFLRPGLRKPWAGRRTKMVRVISYGTNFFESLFGFYPWIGPLSLQLQRRGIQLSLERCSTERLQAICSRKASSHSAFHELLLVGGLPLRYQVLLAGSRRPALLVGAPGPRVALPFVNTDYPGTVSHAAAYLLRRGFCRLALFVIKGRTPGREQMCRAFTAACRNWPHGPIESEIVLVAPEGDGEREVYHRFARRLKPGQGILIASPLSVGLLMTTLLAQGIGLPAQAEVVVIMSHPDSVRIHPPLTHYPFPLNALVKTIATATIHFFETGTLPRLCKVLATEIVPAQGKKAGQI